MTLAERTHDELTEGETQQHGSEGPLSSQIAAPRSASSCGKAGRYMSMVSGPSATIAPSTRIDGGLSAGDPALG